MKPLALLCAAVLCLSLCACTGDPPPPTEPTQSTATSQITSKPTKPSTAKPTTAKPTGSKPTLPPETPVKTIYVRTSYTNVSDTMDARTEYVYDENDLLSEVIQYSGTTQTKRYTVTCDENGNFIRWDSEDDTGMISARYSWDEEGRSLGNSQYLNDVLRYSTVYTWTEDLLTETISNLPDQNMETRLQYTYNSQNIRVRSDYFVNNSLQRYGIYTIDELGRATTISYYTADGTPHSTIHYDYNGLVETQTTQNADGVTTQKLVNTYDAHGNLLSTLTYNGQNKLLSTENYTWIAITVPQDSPRASA